MNPFKKHDLIIFAAILLLALAAFIAVRIAGGTPASYAEVSVNGTVLAAYPLSTDGEYSVNGYVDAAQLNSGTDGSSAVPVVTFSIRDGAVDVTAADCPNLICVNHAPISRTGETIVCLPNRVVITIRGRVREIDAVAH